MLTGKQIALKLSTARYATDLGLIYDTWPKDDRSHDTMRASDHLAIRKAASALDRVGALLSRQLASDGVADYLILPEIKPTIRVRKIPQRFWLEIVVNEPRGIVAAGKVFFVEFSKTEVRFGVRQPIHTSAFEKHAYGPIDHHVSIASVDIGDWQLEQRRPPAKPADCSNDLNTWLTGRVAAQKQEAIIQTLSKTCPNIRPLMGDLVAGLSEASILCDNVENQQMNRTGQLITTPASNAML